MNTSRAATPPITTTTAETTDSEEGSGSGPGERCFYVVHVSMTQQFMSGGIYLLFKTTKAFCTKCPTGTKCAKRRKIK